MWPVSKVRYSGFAQLGCGAGNLRMLGNRIIHHQFALGLQFGFSGLQGGLCLAVGIAGVLQGLSEALRFAQAAELDLDTVFEAISGGAAQSWQMDNRGKTMVADKFDFGFAVDWMRKDLGLVLDEARRNGARVPVTALVDQFYGDVQQLGGGRWDTSSLIKRLT